MFFCYTIAVAYGKQLPIRLDPEIEERLEKVAKRTGTTKSAIIRLLADSFVKQAVAADGSVTLPPNWADLLPPRDTRAGTKKLKPPSPSQVLANDDASDEPLPPKQDVTYDAKGAAKKKT